MLVYISLWAVLIPALWLAEKVPSRQRQVLVFLSFAGMVFLPGLRGMVGPDTPSYLLIYNDIARDSAFSGRFGTIEPLFYILTFAHAKFFYSNSGYLFFISFLQGLLLYRCYKGAADRRFLFISIYLLVFYIEFHFNTLRAGLAALVFLAALQSSGRIKPWILLFVAAGFHISLLAFAPLLAVRYRRKFFLYSFIPFLVIVGVLVFNLDFFQAKLESYYEYLSEYSKGVSKSSVIYSSIVLMSFLLLRRVSGEYIVSGGLIVVFYLLYNFFPIVYRFVFLSAFFYLYYLQEEFVSRRSKLVTGMVLTALLSWHIFITIYGVFFLESAFQDRIKSGETRLIESLDSLYVPYDVYWNKPYLD